MKSEEFLKLCSHLNEDVRKGSALKKNPRRSLQETGDNTKLQIKYSKVNY